MFKGELFSFNEKRCDEFELTLYHINKVESNNFTLASPQKIQEHRLNRSHLGYYLGSTQNEPMIIEMTFGVDNERLDAGNYLKRDEINRILTWLTGDKGYKKLIIIDEDLSDYYYKCFVEKIEIIGNDDTPYGFNCVFKCDSPFAYLNTQIYTKQFETSGASLLNKYGTIEILSQSSHINEYKPIIEIEFTDLSRDVEIINTSINEDEAFIFKDVPMSVEKITIDNQLGLIRNNADLNIYPYFNFKFLKLKRGKNILKIKGNCKITLICDYPVNIGA